ncbi:histidine phosphatase family protein [Mycolicibacterium sp. 050232]|uniref:histidine phosphatase family protein n=1 Tax=Mycolicibacterium sp. 050232 TaxID=3113982 RepID=UPI002E295A6D|nr:histidine phosphatase family protein [Mycolicibacterium sp. 050232]MED5814047.1 histidine phosphatase family protein [Mycolicibacterium sp. 050232]
MALAFLAFFLAMPMAHAAENMRITFIRHGESEGNASGLIDTKTPGPVLTQKGQQQAQAVADKLGDNNYDAIYASQMVRTQLTAGPMSQRLGLPIQVLPGLQEIEAGVFEGTPEANAAGGYGLYPIAWALPGVIPQIPFDKSTYMPGTNLNGYGFDERVDGALKTMYDNGDRNAVVFSHGGTIMFWTMMNATNLTTAQKLELLQTAALKNTDYVVIEGNPEDGWIVTDWNGKKFSPEPTFEHELSLQFRTLSRQLTAAADQVKAAFQTGDIATIATAVNHSVADATFSVTKFGRAINAQIIKRTIGAIPTSTEDVQKDVQEKVSTGLDNVKAAVETNVVTRNLAAVPDAVDESNTAASKLAEEKSADTGAKTKAKDTARSIVKPRATTDLSDGSKALPGVTKSISRTGDQVRTAVKDARDQVSSSVKKFGDAVKKATGQTEKSSGAKDGAGSSAASKKDAA